MDVSTPQDSRRLQPWRKICFSFRCFPCQYWISPISAILCLHWMWVCVEAAPALCFQDQYKTFGVKSLSCSENAKCAMWYFRISVPRCTQSTQRLYVRSYVSSRSVNSSNPRATVPNLYMNEWKYKILKCSTPALQRVTNEANLSNILTVTDKPHNNSEDSKAIYTEYSWNDLRITRNDRPNQL